MTSDHEDFINAIAEYGFDEPTARRLSECTSDRIEMPGDGYKFSIATSSIEGQGVIAVSDFWPAEMVGPARIDGKRTPLGRYTNHAKAPNAVMVVKDNGDIDLVTAQAIPQGQEITIDYRQAGEAQKLRRVL